MWENGAEDEGLDLESGVRDLFKQRGNLFSSMRSF